MRRGTINIFPPTSRKCWRHVHPVPYKLTPILIINVTPRIQSFISQKNMNISSSVRYERVSTVFNDLSLYATTQDYSV